MKKRFDRNEIVARLRDTIATGKPIIGAGCSAGLIARAAELGGADVIICYSTGQSRIRGLQTVNIDHANPQTLSMYDEIRNVVRDTPIIAGVEACDQTVYDLDELAMSTRPSTRPRWCRRAWTWCAPTSAEPRAGWSASPPVR